MDWREFLKPTRWKIFLFIVLVVLAFAVYIFSSMSLALDISYHGPACCDGGPSCSFVYPWLPSYIFVPLSLLYYDCTIILPFLINLPYLYLVSCAVVWLTRVIKK